MQSILWTFLFTNVGDSKCSKGKGFLHLHHNTQTLVGKLLSNTFFSELHLDKTPMATESNNLTCYKCWLHITYSEITSVFSQFFIYTRDCTKLQTSHHIPIFYLSSSETATGGVLWKKVFLKISQNSQKNTCATVAFLIKKRPWHRCFRVNFAKFLRKPFWQNISGRLLLSVSWTHHDIACAKLE